ncbi:MAG: DNA polymerase III subunit gamma/tau [Hyphomicrobiales bacterium]|nr:MAG: DNA polymerase III subunit gamma/tau [Hyphomicrobiales bacterium]
MNDQTNGSSGEKDQEYRVLARKYRPNSFEDMMGQEAMIRTLTNAFVTGRIAQAYMLTGVRGVGKTTTARILARALNYEIPGSVEKPSTVMPEFGTHCQAIIEGRHVDIIEMDAASHTSINDIREIIEASRYKPVSARYKVYIIDEVHMLSTAAFNGLLKTLEEPPGHVKFIFATTEIRKVPITVLSRCQRFDLRRYDADMMTEFLKKISLSENAVVADDALGMLARAGEGSARDSLSLLDQAIALGAGTVSAEDVREMLGLADRSRIVDLFDAVMKGETAIALGLLKSQYDIGAEPAIVLSDLAEFVHLVTRLKFVPQAGEKGAVTQVEGEKGTEFAEALSVRILTRAWQMLLKGISEVQSATNAFAAAEMVLVRLCYAADLPTPDQALKLLRDGKYTAGPVSQGQQPAGSPPSSNGGGTISHHPTDGGSPQMAASGGRMALRLAVENPNPVAVISQPQTGPVLSTYEDIVALVKQKRAIKLQHTLETRVRPVHVEPGILDIALESSSDLSVVTDLQINLSKWTGQRWIVSVSSDKGTETIRERKDAAKQELYDSVGKDPLVVQVMNLFPGASIVDIRVSQSRDTVENDVDADASSPENDDHNPVSTN